LIESVKLWALGQGLPFGLTLKKQLASHLKISQAMSFSAVRIRNACTIVPYECI
jgi:hypothetical protein